MIQQQKVTQFKDTQKIWLDVSLKEYSNGQ